MIVLTEEEKEEMIKSYMTKEEFINMITNIDFKYIKDSHINLVTGFIVGVDREGNEYHKPLSKEIRVE